MRRGSIPNIPEKKWKTEGGDFDPDAVVSRLKGMKDFHWFGSTKSMKHLVQGWIDGTVKNHGVILVGEEGESDPISYSMYHGKQNSKELVPRLIITYTSPTEGSPHLSLNDEMEHQNEMDYTIAQMKQEIMSEIAAEMTAKIDTMRADVEQQMAVQMLNLEEYASTAQKQHITEEVTKSVANHMDSKQSDVITNLNKTIAISLEEGGFIKEPKGFVYGTEVIFGFAYISLVVAIMRVGLQNSRDEDPDASEPGIVDHALNDNEMVNETEMV